MKRQTKRGFLELLRKVVPVRKGKSGTRDTDEEEKKSTLFPVCFLCQHNLVWDDDLYRSDCGLIPDSIEDDDERGKHDGLIELYHCPHCGAKYEVYHPTSADTEEVEGVSASPLG